MAGCFYISLCISMILLVAQPVTKPQIRTEVLAPIPPLEVSAQLDTHAPDGTVLLTALHAGADANDLLRIWRVLDGRYSLVKEYPGEERSHLSAEEFRYRGKVYLHVERLWDGTAHEHADDVFRVEMGGLTTIEMPKGLPLPLAPGEGVWKGISETYNDDDLEFEFGIYRVTDANCCPTAGWVKGTYTIAGDVLQYGSWKRYTERPESGRSN